MIHSETKQPVSHWIIRSKHSVRNTSSFLLSVAPDNSVFCCIWWNKLINCQAIIVSVTLRKVIAHLINKFLYIVYFCHTNVAVLGICTNTMFFRHDSVMIEKMQRLSVCFTKSNSKEFWTSVVNMPWNTSVEMLNLIWANGTEVNQKQHTFVINAVHLCFGLFFPKPCKKLISFSKSSCGHPNAMKTEEFNTSLRT